MRQLCSWQCELIYEKLLIDWQSPRPNNANSHIPQKVSLCVTISECDAEKLQSSEKKSLLDVHFQLACGHSTAAQQFMRLSRLCSSVSPSPLQPACQLVQHRTWTFCTTLVTCSQTNRIASHHVAGRQSIWLARTAQFEFCSVTMLMLMFKMLQYLLIEPRLK